MASKVYFKKLGIKSPLELCLIPIKHEVYEPICEHNLHGWADVEIVGYEHFRSLLKIEAILESSLTFAPNSKVKLLFKHQSPWIQASFQVGKRMRIFGSFTIESDALSIWHPRVISTSRVSITFGSKIAKSKTILRLIHENFEAIKAPLPQEAIKALEQMYYPPESCTLKELLDSSSYAQKFIEIYLHLLTLSRLKKETLCKFSTPNHPKSFIDGLPFTLTQDQRNAIFDIYNDLQSPNAARRMIMGDVGSGKTIVMLSSVFMVLPKKSVIMVPTTILARQILNEAKKLLPQATIALITGKSKDDSKDAHLIIGTQALLHQNFDPKDFALLLIDEQHKFGTKQRAHLEKMLRDGEGVHFLQFSATPIPRTLAMINQCYIAHSFLKQMPYPKNIQTKIIRKNEFLKLKSHLESELADGRQAIIVYPLVEASASKSKSLLEAQAWWQENFDDVYITYGSDSEKERILESFKEGGKILLTTTLIEVGISLPKLSTIVISGASRLGLSTLHQLRGRVSRNGLLGYCFLVEDEENERLLEFAKTTNGFEVAELDLKYRHSGLLLSGERQSGKSFAYFDEISDEGILKQALGALKEIEIQGELNER